MILKSLHRNLKVRLLEILIVQTFNNMLYPFLAIYFAKNFGSGIAGLLLTITVLSGICFGFFGGALSDKIGRKKVMLISETVRFFSLIVATLANSPWWDNPWGTFFMMTVNNICWGIATPALEAMIIDVSNADNRKIFYGVQYWAINIGMILGSILGGFLFMDNRFLIFFLVTVASLFSITLVWFFITESHINLLREEPHKNIFFMLYL